MKKLFTISFALALLFSCTTHTATLATTLLTTTTTTTTTTTVPPPAKIEFTSSVQCDNPLPDITVKVLEVEWRESATGDLGIYDFVILIQNGMKDIAIIGWNESSISYNYNSYRIFLGNTDLKDAGKSTRASQILKGQEFSQRIFSSEQVKLFAGVRYIAPMPSSIRAVLYILAGGKKGYYTILISKK